MERERRRVREGKGGKWRGEGGEKAGMDA